MFLPVSCMGKKKKNNQNAKEILKYGHLKALKLEMFYSDLESIHIPKNVYYISNISINISDKIWIELKIYQNKMGVQD